MIIDGIYYPQWKYQIHKQSDTGCVIVGWCCTLGKSVTFWSEASKSGNETNYYINLSVRYDVTQQNNKLSGGLATVVIQANTKNRSPVGGEGWQVNIWTNDGRTLDYHHPPVFSLLKTTDYYVGALRAASDTLSSLDTFVPPNLKRFNTWSSNGMGVEDYIYPATLDRTSFIYHEPEFIQEKLDPYLENRDGVVYWRNWLIQHAYVDALEAAPKMNDNNISNIAEIASFIINLVLKRRIVIPRRLQDLWLAYRYTYGTGRQDAEEAIKFMHRYANLGGLDGMVKCYGYATTDSVQGIPTLCRCQLKLKPKELEQLGKLWRALYTYGLQPNFYTLWDMIPYSFIVDWLIPVGDIAHVADIQRQYSGTNYQISDVIFSLEYEWKHPTRGDLHCYSRWSSAPLSSLNEFYWFDKPSSSSKTKLFRVLDTASLLIK
jgi:hypothetical protein